MALLPLVAGGCHKLGPDQPALQTVTLTGTAVAPADQVRGLVPASPAIQLARRDGQPNVPLAYARVQALDAALQPVPGVSEVRTDAGGRYAMNVPAGPTYVLRFSVGGDERRLDLMTLARARADEGAQVVNADAASLVATRVILGRANGLDAALEALGAPELRGVVEVIRSGLGSKVLRLTSPEAVNQAVAAEQEDEALLPVLARVDKAVADAAAIKPPPMVTSRVVAAAMAATAGIPVAPASTPTPAASPTPPPADAYRVVPQPEPQAEQPAIAVAPRIDSFEPRRRAAVPDVDPFWYARERAHVRIDALLSGRPQVSGSRRSDPVILSEPAKVSLPGKPSVVRQAKTARPGHGAIKVASLKAVSVAVKANCLGRSIPRLLALAPATDPRRDVAHESARPIVVVAAREDNKGPIVRVVSFLARFLPRFQPPTGARPS